MKPHQFVAFIELILFKERTSNMQLQTAAALKPEMNLNQPLNVFGLGLLLPLLIYSVLRVIPGANRHFHQTTEHFYIVSLTAICAAGIAVFIGLIGSRLRNLQVVLMALSFVSLGVVFATHGLSTPDFWLGQNRVVAISAQLSITLMSVWLFLSSFPADTLVLKILARHPRVLVIGYALFWVIVCVAALLKPELANWIPIDSNPLHVPISLLSMSILLLTAWRYWTSYRFTRSVLQLAIVYVALWMTVTQLIISTSKLWEISWWFYHALMFLAVGVMIWALIKQYSQGSLVAALAGIWSTNPISRLESVISPSLQALINATENHDSYTAGHNKRVAIHAVQIGQALKLSPESLRALAQGGWVHDLGKLEIPAEILNKPGKLEPAERKLIETHPATGYEYAQRIGFLPEELEVIRHHHEKWDGTGYPDGLAETRIPLLARITAIADVYDALTSKRSYREPWTHERTREYILAQAGKHFDPESSRVWGELTKNGALKDTIEI
jgi:hypothetical protein